MTTNDKDSPARTALHVSAESPLAAHEALIRLAGVRKLNIKNLPTARL